VDLGLGAARSLDSFGLQMPKADALAAHLPAGAVRPAAKRT
jgi:hypothetical protein